MCGICGIIQFNGASAKIVDAAQKMNAAIRHRGPDGEGFLVAGAAGNFVNAFSGETPVEVRSATLPHSPKKNIGELSGPAQLVLAHRRLAILDLSPAGHQPLCTRDEKLWITYNGEVYNYKELRAELESLGHIFFTHTDTEVVLAAYRQWGEKCLHRFNGMWAFVIWDREKNILFGARDRFGVKPFYYYRDQNIFTFASEQKALLKNPFVKTSLNAAAVADYFVAGEIEYREESFFKNIFELFPGCSFTLSPASGKFELNEWYQLPGKITQEEISIETIREMLVNAVRLRLRADVPVGSCLSGGIDSSAIAGIIGHLVAQHENVNVGDRLKLFTAVFDEPKIDERKWAKEVVQQTGADWKTVAPRPEELLGDLETMLYSQDVPVWSTSTYAQFRVMRLAKENNIRVVLDGQGGDELFAGYFPYFIPFWKELKKNGETKRLHEEMAAFGTDAKQYRKRETLKQYTFPSLPLWLQFRIEKKYFPDTQYFSPELFSEYKRNYKREQSPATLNDALRHEFVNTRLKGYLKCEDRCSMWHSVESRTPFADDVTLIEKMFSIPGTQKIRNGVSKYFLREAAAPFLPENIRKRRDKLGYATPNNKWIAQLRNEFRPYFEQDFSGIINTKKLLRDYDKIFNLENQQDNGRIFKFIAFAVWKKVTGM